jgi:hypothetical protein
VNFSSASFDVDRHGDATGAADLKDADAGTPGLITTATLDEMSGTFTMAVWTTGETFGNETRLLGQEDFFQIFFDGSDTVFGIVDGAEIDDANSVRAVGVGPDEAWSFFVGVVEQTDLNESAIRLFVDGTLRAETTVPRLFANPAGCRFAVGPFGNGDPCTQQDLSDGDQGYPGFVDDVRVYGRALTPGEIQLLFGEE